MRMVLTGFAMIWCAAALAQAMPPVTGGGSLDGLAGTSTLVTIVLKPSGALDTNLRVISVGPEFVSVMAESGETAAYLLSSIQEVRVQSERVERLEIKPADIATLRIEEQRVLDRALARAREIFDRASTNQALKMRAATVLAANGDIECLDYLQRLAAADHIETELDAYQCLYLAGWDEVSSQLISDGLQSGNRQTRARAATLAGLYGDVEAIPALEGMAQDRLAELSAPAAKALARLGQRSIIPTLMKMIGELSEQKGRAAVSGLALLGGPDVIAEASAKLETATGANRYRLIQLLYALEVPEGMRLLETEGMADQGWARNSAAALAKRGNWTGRQHLMSFLRTRFWDKTEVNLVNRAEAAVALVIAGDLTATSEIQNLLSVPNAGARKKICLLLAVNANRRLITVMQPIIENTDMEVAVEACVAVYAMARPQFQKRLAETLDK